MKHAREVMSLLDALIELMEEYEQSEWAQALRFDRKQVSQERAGAYSTIGYRLSAHDGLGELSIGLGDKRLNSELQALLARLRDLTAPEPEPEPEPSEPPRYGERLETIAEEPEIVFADDFPRGSLVFDGQSFYRSTWTLLSHNRRGRLVPFVRVWNPCEPVSLEEYRSLSRSCVGWWCTLVGVIPVSVVGFLTFVPIEALELVYYVGFAMLVGAATMVGVLERRRSGVAALWSERTGRLITPVSRGSRLL